MATPYPFTAIIGQEAMQTALLICAVDPTIGGVLVRGQKGTAKSTTARSLAAVLPSIEVVSGCPYHCDPGKTELLHVACRQHLDEQGKLARECIATPFVDLPLSATEDRLVGTLHLENTLRSGQRQFEPGLFAAAHRGILYVDEVNLLPDHLVDMLLDTAASGVNLVEREGLQYSHPSRFLLLGTMNPEEGELRPQFLDRFGLCVTVAGLADVTQRCEIIQRRMAYDSCPESFSHDYAACEETLRNQVWQARKSLRDVAIPEEIIHKAAELAAKAKAQGHRAELTLVRAARALAALMERTSASEHELAEVAGFALAHRIPGQTVLAQAELDRKISQLLESKELTAADTDKRSSEVEQAVMLDDINFPGSAAAGSMLFTYLKKKLTTATSQSMRPST